MTVAENMRQEAENALIMHHTYKNVGQTQIAERYWGQYRGLCLALSMLTGEKPLDIELAIEAEYLGCDCV